MKHIRQKCIKNIQNNYLLTKLSNIYVLYKKCNNVINSSKQKPRIRYIIQGKRCALNYKYRAGKPPTHIPNFAFCLSSAQEYSRQNSVIGRIGPLVRMTRICSAAHGSTAMMRRHKCADIADTPPAPLLYNSSCLRGLHFSDAEKAVVRAKQLSGHRLFRNHKQVTGRGGGVSGCFGDELVKYGS